LNSIEIEDEMRVRVLTVVSVILLWAGLAGAAKPEAQDTLYEQIRHNMGLFGDVYRELSLRYVDRIDPNKFMRAGIDGMLSTLDPYTVFFDERGTEDLDLITSGRYGGVGIEIGVRGRDKQLTVISAMDDSPAQHAGIRSGDRILAIDTVSTEGFSTADAAKYLRGAADTPVKLSIERTGSSEPIVFVITRKEIEVKDIPYFGFVKPSVGYIKLAHFSRGAPEELDSALTELQKGGMRSLILDLRGNPGGLLSSAVGVLQRFCAKDETVLSVRGRDSDNAQVFKIPTEPLAGKVTLAVLVDGGSASASEIVAGAVQDLDRGVLFGDPTFGKGLVQSVVSFETGEALKLTTAKYYTPSGRLIQRVDYFHDEDGVVLGDADNDAAGHFSTRNGRPVSGHGGVTPDILIPSPQPGPLGTELWRQGAFLDFVNDYRARHATLTSPTISPEGFVEFRRWLDSTHFSYEADGKADLDSLRKRVAELPMADSLTIDFARIEAALTARREQDYTREHEFIRQSLEGELAANMFGPRGRIEASFAEDPLILKSLEVFANKPEYDKLLAVGESTRKE
jgi:carboxyl-terminal processing protease